MAGLKTIAVAGAGVIAVLVLGAAQHLAALAQTAGGMWEITGAPGEKAPLRQCVADPAALAQFEHRGKACTRVVIRDSGTESVIHYTCAGGGFGDSKLTVITPRSLKIETQGIAGDGPFNYVLQARRVGDCAAR
jgi:hypothetical protein